MSVANANAANAALDSMREDKRQQQVEAVENLGTKQWLESKLEESTKTVPVMGREFEFRNVGTETVADVMEMVPEGKDDMDLDELPGMLRRICEILGEHCTDPVMDASAFGQLPPEVNQRVFEDVAMGDLSEEELEQIEQFR